MNPLNPFAVSGILLVVLYLPLSIFVIIKGRSKLAKLYGLYLFAIAMWGLSAILIGTIRDLTTVKLVWKIAYSWVLFIPPFFYHTSHEMSQRKTKWDIIFVYGQAIFFTVAIFQDKLMSKFDIMFNSFYFHQATSTLTLSFIFWATIGTSGYFLLLKSLNNTFPKQKSELKTILNLTLLGFLGGSANWLPAYGWDIYPWGNFLIVAPTLAITAAIFKFQFLDIKVVLRKSFAYSILILVAALLYFGIIIISEKFIQGFWGYKSITISILIAFTIGILFFPLHNYVQKLVDKLIFKKTTEEISKENELLRAEAFQTEKLKSIAMLSSGIAHEIRNPLTALKTFVEYFPKKKNDPEFIAKFESIAGTEISRIESILNELLSFAKPSPLSLIDTDIKKTLEHAINLTANQLNKNKVTIKTDFADNIPNLKADTNKLLQVFINLILNANDAMNTGGTLTIVTSGSWLGASDSTNPKPLDPNPSIKITLTDTGSGIESKDLTKIFDPFFSTKEKGTGLGLAIVKGIIENHGGKITVKSIKNQGTTFTITLPTTSDTNEVQV